jgi:hypothetical protein
LSNSPLHNNVALAGDYILDARRNGRMPPATVQQPPQPEHVALPQPDTESERTDLNFDDYDGSQFDEWNKMFEAYVDADATKEVA